MRHFAFNLFINGALTPQVSASYILPHTWNHRQLHLYWRMRQTLSEWHHHSRWNLPCGTGRASFTWFGLSTDPPIERELAVFFALTVGWLKCASGILLLFLSGTDSLCGSRRLFRYKPSSIIHFTVKRQVLFCWQIFLLERIGFFSCLLSVDFLPMITDFSSNL